VAKRVLFQGFRSAYLAYDPSAAQDLKPGSTMAKRFNKRVISSYRVHDRGSMGFMDWIRGSGAMLAAHSRRMERRGGYRTE